MCPHNLGSLFLSNVRFAILPTLTPLAPQRRSEDYNIGKALPYALAPADSDVTCRFISTLDLPSRKLTWIPKTMVWKSCRGRMQWIRKCRRWFGKRNSLLAIAIFW